MNENLRRELVKRAARVVVELLENYDILFLIPPGSSRIEVVSEARRLLQEKGVPVEVVSYRIPLSTEELSASELGRKLVEILEKRVTGKYVVIPRDTTTAVLLAREIKERGLAEAGKVCFLNIAEIYGELIDRVEEHFKLEYEHVKKELEGLEIQLKPGCGGVSLTLVGRGSKEACRKISSLAPEKSMSVKDILGKLQATSPQQLIPLLISVVYHFVEFTLLLRPETKLAIRISRDIVLNAARSLLGSSRGDFRKLLVDFLVKSRDIAKHVDEELYEGLLDSIASKWGLTLDEFKVLVKNLAKIAGGELAKVEDIESRVEEKLKNYEEWFRRIENELDIVEQQLITLTILHGIYKDIEHYPYVRFESGKYYIKLWKDRYELATTETYLELSSEVESKILNDRFVLITGSSGAGKSVFSHYVVARILARSKVEGVSRRVYVVSSLGGEENYQARSSLIRAAELAGGLGEHLIVVYDPVPPDVYTTPTSRPSIERVLMSIGRDIELLLEVYSNWDNVSVVIVVPKHVYTRIGEYFKQLRREHLEFIVKHTIDFDERIRAGLEEFVEKLLRVYSNCENVRELAMRICSEFKESHALIAKQAGLLLKRRECRVQDLAEFMKEARGESKAFINIIVRERLGVHRLAMSVREELLRKYAPILAVRAPFTRRVPFGQYIATPNLMSYLMRFAGLQDSEVEKNYDWLSLRNEDIVEEVLLEVLNEAVRVSPDTRVPEDIDDAITLVLDKWSIQVWNAILSHASSLDCLRKLFFIVGSAPFELDSPFKFKTLYEEFKEWALSKRLLGLESCRELDELLIVDNQIPLLTSTLLLVSVLRGLPADLLVKDGGVDACGLVSEVRKLLQDDFSLDPLPYALGLSLLSLRDSRCREDTVGLMRLALLGVLYERLLSEDLVSYMLDHIVRTLIDLYGEPSTIPLIDMYATLVRDYRRVLELVDRLVEQRDKLESWMKAILVRAIAELPWKTPSLDEASGYSNVAEHIVSEIRQVDELLGLIAETYLEIFKAKYLLRVCILDQALKSIEKAEKNIELIGEHVRDGKLTRELARYLYYTSLQEPENAMHDELVVLTSTCLLIKALALLHKGLNYKDTECFNKAVEVYKQIANLNNNTCLYYRFELARIIAHMLAETNIGDWFLKELTNLFVSAWNMMCFETGSHVLTALIIAKTLLNQDLTVELEIGRFLLRYIGPEVLVTTWLFLSALGRVEKPDFDYVFSIVRPHLRSDIMPLWLLERGIRRRDLASIRDEIVMFRDYYTEIFGQDIVSGLEKIRGEDELKGYLGMIETQLYERELKHALQLIQESPEMADVLGPRYVFELLAPISAFGHFTLLLYALAESDFQLAKAHAKLASKIRCIGPPFSELYNALEESEKKGELTREASLCLAKILLFHIIV